MTGKSALCGSATGSGLDLFLRAVFHRSLGLNCRKSSNKVRAEAEANTCAETKTESVVLPLVTGKAKSWRREFARLAYMTIDIRICGSRLTILISRSLRSLENFAPLRAAGATTTIQQLSDSVFSCRAFAMGDVVLEK
jgi:hypothetical protein